MTLLPVPASTEPPPPQLRTVLSRPTIDDVAAAAGVSRATVSRALSGGHRVSTSAMAAIQQAVQRTGYVVNRHARNLASHRPQSVTFILCEPQQRLVEDPNFNVLLSGCSQALARHDLALTVAVAGGTDVRAWLRRHIVGGQVDGALVVSAHANNPIADELRASDIPVVVYGAPAVDTDRRLAYVAADDRGGARQIVRHLRERGRRTIATIAGPPGTTCGVQRLAGWRDVLGPAAEERLVATGDYTCAGGQAAMAQLLDQAPDLDAVFASADLMAAGALVTLSRAGRRVPADVAVAGFEDAAVATAVWPPLTTVRRPLPRISTEMVRLLLDQLDGRPPAAVTLPTELVTRDST